MSFVIISLGDSTSVVSLFVGFRDDWLRTSPSVSRVSSRSYSTLPGCLRVLKSNRNHSALGIMVVYRYLTSFVYDGRVLLVKLRVRNTRPRGVQSLGWCLLGVTSSFGPQMVRK